MFDAELKREFVDEYTASRMVHRSYVEGVIDTISKEEVDLQKPCTDFTREEILNMYQNKQFASDGVASNFHVVVKSYVAYVSVNKTGEKNLYAYRDITSGDIEIKKRSVFRRADIIDIENQLLNYSDVALVECLWEGISGNGLEDIIKISNQTVDFNRNVLEVNGNTYDLTPRLSGLIELALKEMEYVSYQANAIVFTVLPGTMIKRIRMNDNSDIKKEAIYFRLRTIKNYLGLESFSVSMIMNSGFVYNVQEAAERAGQDIYQYISSFEGMKLIERYGFTGGYAVGNAFKKLKSLIKSM